MAWCLVLSASPALACRIFTPPQTLLADYPERVLVRVLTAQPVDNPGWQTWSIVAEPEEPSAAGQQATYAFRSTLYSNGCELADLPSPGDLWTVYFETGSSEVRLAHPRFWLQERQAEQLEQE